MFTSRQIADLILQSQESEVLDAMKTVQATLPELFDKICGDRVKTLTNRRLRDAANMMRAQADAELRNARILEQEVNPASAFIGYD